MDAAKPANGKDAGGDRPDSTPNTGGGPAPDPTEIPERLEDTGLYESELGGALAAGVRAVEPLYPQWVDGASKRRWLLLPEGEVIDTSDMDDWDFPVGTKAWEELRRDGNRTETRYLFRYGPREDHWLMVAYRWQKGRATASPDGVDADDDRYIPSERDCRDCHASRRSHLLGVSAIQLSHDRSEVNLAALDGAGLLSHPPPGDYVLPGGDDERDALGYLHANCGCCHNPDGDPFVNEGIPMQHWQRIDDLASVEATLSFATSVGVESEAFLGRTIVVAGNPDDSLLLELMNQRGEDQMPPVGSTMVDTAGVEIMRGFIESLAPLDTDAGGP